ncbi:GNAT family N-acetyltransferase [Actinoplanes friuliensis]|uniref:YjdG-like N-acetyltransferase n=1 Tax=Actinoplanes friuliensis DSM 7358 TaxID=1246995 RepID=U5W0F0_9ACTN|nr:GNAT family N-acetyltransferase [Actinoplanes friuliensis]AGZ42569.1 yjdG-like N-acetyltransferase [Actinoplanes friuliensis DSM 7358]
MIRFVELPPAALQALIESDLPAAGAAAGQELSEYILGEKWLWEMRFEQIARDPASAEWIARAVVAEPEQVVIGHAGFHGPPDADGMVEVAYSVAPAYRRRGFAKEMLAALIARAETDPRVRVVRASISPENAASLATIAGFGFVQVGEQWDEEDGLELLFERPA